MLFQSVDLQEVAKYEQEVGKVEVEEEVEDVQTATGKIPPLNILILIVGSRGDVQPFIAFGKALQKAGHNVRLSTHVNFRNFVPDNGLGYYPLKGDPEDLMNFMVNHPDMVTLNPQEIKRKKKMMRLIYFSTWDAATRLGFTPDVVISNPPVHVPVHLAQKLQVPLQIMFTMPWSKTKDYMHPLAPYQSALSNEASYRVVDVMIWVGLGGLQNEFRKKLGLEQIQSGASLIPRLKIPMTYCMSPHLAPKPTDWGKHIDVVGFWYLDLKSDFKPPQDLVDFLKAGDPPIYVGFGSIVVDNPKLLSQNVIEAIKISGQRALVGSGWAKLGEGMDLPNTIKLVGAVPHDWLFPQCSAVCHHGGAGTIAAGLKSGCPTIVVPFFGDQPFWGNCVSRMKVGPDPIPYKELTKEKLAAAITFCTQPEVREAAKNLGQKLRDEDGLQAAVDAFHRKLPIVNGVWACEVHENQRKQLFGWGHKLLPTDRDKYTERTGILSVTFNGFVLPPGWEWQGDWQPQVIIGQTDKDGWKYRPSFDSKVPWHTNETGSDFVRTRKFQRFRVYTGNVPKVPFNKFLLYVEVIEAKDVISMDIGSESDPYVRISVKSNDPQKQKTHHVNNNRNPVWKETFWYEVSLDDTLLVECYDYDDVGKDDLVGSTEISVQQIIQKNIKDTWVEVVDKKKKVGGSVHLVFSKYPN